MEEQQYFSSKTRQKRLNTERKKSNKALKIILILVLLIAVSAVGAYAFNGWMEYNRLIAHMTQVVEIDNIYEGISIDGIDVGGLTVEEAEELLIAHSLTRLDEISITITHNEKSWNIDYTDISAKIDFSDNLHSAFMIAREGELTDRYNLINEIKNTGKEFFTEITYDLNLLLPIIDDIAVEVKRSPQDATIEFMPDAEILFNVTPDVAGVEIDKERLFDELTTKIEAKDFSGIEVVTIEIVPEVKAAQLEKLTNRIAQFYTGFGTSSQNRIHNVRFSMSKVNGYRLDPGQTFSFNEAVGRRTVARGFRPAPIIMPDRSLQDSPGGGVCQASTMMYNIALLADLEIVQRRHHSFPVFYVPPGLDAAVVYGSLDVQFRNNRETPIFFRAFYEDGKIFVEAYGEPFPYSGEIKLVSTITETIAAPVPKRVLDVNKEHVTNPGEEKVHVENRRGLRVRTTMHYYENGEEKWSRVVSNDFYRPIQGIIYYLPPLPEPQLELQPELQPEFQPDTTQTNETSGNSGQGNNN